ncbi:MAG: MFS transporter [Acidimicrobiia bacterium]|nr:MFS transporter [Acidimicrobiia bacterium]
MGASTFTAAIISILGIFLVDEFALTRAQLGLVVAVNTILAGLVSPMAGKFVDRAGGGMSLLVLLQISSLSFVLIALSPGLGVLLVAAGVGGVAQALANPATNKVIAYRYQPARRADITGIKQSGVQFAIFFGGLSLPSLAEWLGWRWAVGVVVALTLLVAVWLEVARKGVSSGRGGSGSSATSALSGAVPWLAGYGFLLGFSGSASFFLPLFAEEELGQSVRVGGFALALAGLAAIVGRVLWARFAERGGRYRITLAILAALAVVGMLAFRIADTSLLFLWVGALLMGAGSSSWNSVGMLAVIDSSEATDTGAASGWVLLGFLIGLGAGPPIYGLTYDATSSYDTMWAVAAVFAALALLVMVGWGAVERNRTA